jgi:hypothetical protein
MQKILTTLRIMRILGSIQQKNRLRKSLLPGWAVSILSDALGASSRQKEAPLTKKKEKVSGPDRRQSLLRAVFPTDEKSKARIDFDLSERECALIGLANVHWAYLEHRLLMATKEIAEELGIALPHTATPNAFNERLADFRLVVQQIPEEAAKTRFAEIANKISNENGFRQKLVHGIWSYDSVNPETLHVEVSRSHNPPRAFFQENQIRDFALRVGELSFQLTFPEDYTSEQLFIDNGQASFSRSFLRQLRSKE